MFLGNQLTQPQQYQAIINPNIHTGSIPSTGRSSYAPVNHFPTHIPAEKAVEDTRMLIEQTNRMIGNKNGANLVISSEVEKGAILTTPTSYIDQPMLSAMQQMFNNANSSMHPQTMKPIYQNTQQQIYFNPL